MDRKFRTESGRLGGRPRVDEDLGNTTVLERVTVHLKFFTIIAREYNQYRPIDFPVYTQHAQSQQALAGIDQHLIKVISRTGSGAGSTKSHIAIVVT